MSPPHIRQIQIAIPKEPFLTSSDTEMQFVEGKVEAVDPWEG